MKGVGGVYLGYITGGLLWDAIFGEGDAPIGGSGGRLADNFSRQLPAGMPGGLPAGLRLPDELKVRIVKVRGGDAGVKDRADLLGGLIKKYGQDPAMHMLAASILNRPCAGGHCTPEKRWDLEVAELFGYVRQNVRYMRDPARIDAFHSPWRTLQMRGGDCDDGAAVLGALLEAAGYQTGLRIIQTTDSPGPNHVYNLVKIPPPGEGWAALDVSMDRPAGWQAPGAAEVAKAGGKGPAVGITSKVWDFEV